MNTFEYKGEMFALIDGDVWIRLAKATDGLHSVLEENPPEQRRRGRRPRSTPKNSMLATQQAIREYKPRRSRLGPDAEEAVKADIEAGLGMSETVRKYDISVGTFYRLKGELKNRPVVEEQLT